MRRPSTSPVVRALLLAVLALPSAGPARAVYVPAPTVPKGGWLPDTLVLARIGARKITVYDYRWNWYSSDPELRPRPDSAGRVVALHDFENKELLGQAAQQTKYQFDFADRAQFREFRNQTLSNVLFQRAVQDVPAVSDDSLKKVCTYYSRDLRLRLLYFSTREQAEATRMSLVTGRLTWAAATARYGVHTQTVINGVSGWLKFGAVATGVALQIWPLGVGQVSPVIMAASGYHVAQVLEEKIGKPYPFVAMRSAIKMAVEGVEQDKRRAAIQAEAKQGMDVAYDTTNVVWAAGFFRESKHIGTEGIEMSLNVDERVPEFASEDTSRTMVRWKGGRLSLGDIVHEYTDMVPITRPSLNTPEALFSFIDAIMLGPKMTEIAEKRGLERDSAVVAALDKKREAMLVEHMVEDSVLSRVSVTKDERRAYYQANQRDFIAYPTVTYAMLVRHSRGAADSTKALLDRGANADSLVKVDEKLGIPSATNTVRTNEPSDYHKALFEEMRPGQSIVLGPDKDKLFGVLHEIAYDKGSLVPYDQVESAIDESVRNIKGDRAVQEFLARLKQRFPVTDHPELVMRIDLTDPASTGR